MIVLANRFLVPKGFIGITLFPFIIVRNKDMKNDRHFMQHEHIHLKQQLELLIIPFFLWYFIEFLLRWIILKNAHQAYRSISFEREAYTFENLPNYLHQRKNYAFLTFL